MDVFGGETPTLRTTPLPRAHRHFLPGQHWHITHRCHRKSFLLKFARDRSAYRHWLFEARKRFGLCVLNYVVTSNHVHLLVKDRGEDVIARSMQLVAGRTGQEFNGRKSRRGAFWEDRYHATAIETGAHLLLCLVYIDLNMVRAGAVRHPLEWAHGGYREIQHPPARYTLIDLDTVSDSCGFATVAAFQQAHRHWVEEALASAVHERDACWSEAIAVGSDAFVDRVRRELAGKARHRSIEEKDDACVLRVPRMRYDVDSGIKNIDLRLENTVRWTEMSVNT